MTTPPVPERLKNFPRYRGFIVHYTVFIREDGVPDFRVMHEVRRLEAFKKNLCHLCGQRMSPPYALIGGEKCVEHHLFVDGPMHEDCARYAAAVCPFLASPTGAYNREKDLPAGAKEYEEVRVTTERSPRMALVLTGSYAVDYSRPSAEMTVTPGEYLLVDWTAMPPTQRRDDSAQNPKEDG